MSRAMSGHGFPLHHVELVCAVTGVTRRLHTLASFVRPAVRSVSAMAISPMAIYQSLQHCTCCLEKLLRRNTFLRDIGRQ
jgi:hypothetical protein